MQIPRDAATICGIKPALTTNAMCLLQRQRMRLTRASATASCKKKKIVLQEYKKQCGSVTEIRFVSKFAAEANLSMQIQTLV